MKFGLILPTYGDRPAAPGELSELAAAAEQAGFDSLWTTDHILLPPDEARRFRGLSEALIVLAFLAGQTDRIRLGVSSLILAQRHPILVAKQLASLDYLSHGRTLLCVSAGWSQTEFTFLGQDFHQRGRRLDEAIRLMRALFGSNPADPVQFSGEWWRFGPAVFEPHLTQPGGPPIWIGGHAPAALRRAAELGDGWHPSGLPIEAFLSSVSRLTSMRSQRRLTISLRARVSLDGADPHAILTGPISAIADSLAAYAQAGLHYPVIDLRAADHGQRLSWLERVATDLLPAFPEGAE
jgi:probable F420-dependent oxidoreductase